MKVLHVIPSLSRVHGGPTRALTLMEAALAEQGVEVETVTTDDDGPGRRNGKACGLPVQEGNGLRRYFPKLIDFYKPSPALAKWLNAHVADYDVVHIHALFSHASVVAARAARRACVPYVIRPLGTLGTYGMGRRRPWLKAASLQILEGPLLRDAAAVHFTSEQEALEASLRRIPMKAVVIPLAVEPASAPTNSDALPGLRGDPLVLFLSRLDAKKNVEGLLAAVALLQDEFPALSLLVAGDGDPTYVARLKSLAASKGISNRVTWLGHIDGGVKSAAFAMADVFVLPSFSENFGIAAAEALAAGLPCVLGEGVAIARQVEDAGAGVVVGTEPRSIAEGLRRIIGTQASRQTMSAHARQLAGQRFSMHAMGSELKKLYTGILA